jgi:hypothetical protein
MSAVFPWKRGPSARRDDIDPGREIGSFQHRPIAQLLTLGLVERADPDGRRYRAVQQTDRRAG